LLEEMQEEVRKIMGERESAPYKIRAIRGMLEEALLDLYQIPGKERWDN